MGLSQFEEVFPLNGMQQIDATAALSLQWFAGNGPQPVRWDTLWVTNTDSIDHVVRLYYNSGGPDYLLGSVNVPAGAGVAGSPSIELLSAILGTPPTQIVIPSTDALKVGVEVAVTGSFLVTIVGFGGFV